MNTREEAAWEVHTFFSELGVPYAIIGGMAVQRWGEPRFTQDVDVTVAAPLDDLEGFVRAIVARFTSRVEDAVTFARRTRVVLVRASNNCGVDISLALPGYEDQVMRRAVDYELEPGKVVRMCSAEDLIIHKAVAGRPRDVKDIEGIVYRQRDALDVAYIRLWLSEFADVLENPELLERFETPWRKIQSVDS
jgi:hypothetical protein